jgi:hypothetical protein
MNLILVLIERFSVVLRHANRYSNKFKLKIVIRFNIIQLE